jgi:hypothetical protein
VAERTIRACPSVWAEPVRHIDSEHDPALSTGAVDAWQRHAGGEASEAFGIYFPGIQAVVESAVASAMRRFQRQMGEIGDRTWGA